jgi:hypothetical protein
MNQPTDPIHVKIIRKRQVNPTKVVAETAQREIDAAVKSHLEKLLENCNENPSN